MERSSPYVGIREGETFCDAADWNETVIESGIRDLIRLIPFVLNGMRIYARTPLALGGPIGLVPLEQLEVI